LSRPNLEAVAAAVVDEVVAAAAVAMREWVAAVEPAAVSAAVLV